MISIATDTDFETIATGENPVNTEIVTLMTQETATVHGVVYDSVKAFKLLLLIEAYPVHICCPTLAAGST